MFSIIVDLVQIALGAFGGYVGYAQLKSSLRSTEREEEKKSDTDDEDSDGPQA